MSIAPKKIWSVDTVPGPWERISFDIDTIMPPTVANYEISDTEMSKKGTGFRAETGAPIKHCGRRTLQGIGDDYQPLSMTAQGADIKKQWDQ